MDRRPDASFGSVFLTQNHLLQSVPFQENGFQSNSMKEKREGEEKSAERIMEERIFAGESSQYIEQYVRSGLLQKSYSRVLSFVFLAKHKWQK